MPFQVQLEIYSKPHTHRIPSVHSLNAEHGKWISEKKPKPRRKKSVVCWKRSKNAHRLNRRFNEVMISARRSAELSHWPNIQRQHSLPFLISHETKRSIFLFCNPVLSVVQPSVAWAIFSSPVFYGVSVTESGSNDTKYSTKVKK